MYQHPNCVPVLQVKRRTDTCGEYGSFVNGPATGQRATNPLNPHYSLSSQPGLYAHPRAAFEPLTKEGHVFVDRRHADWGFDKGSVLTGTLSADDIERAAPATRLRRVRMLLHACLHESAAISRGRERTSICT